MHFWVGMYLLLGFAWCMVIFTSHPAVMELRRLAGDLRTMLIMIPVLLLWPVEIVAVVVYYVRRFFARLAMAWHVRRMVRSLSRLTGCTTVACSGCGRIASSGAIAKESGWSVVMNESGMSFRCPQCTRDIPR